jgi:hypothetical protein
MANCVFCNLEADGGDHHLIPQTTHSNRRVQKTYTRDQMRVKVPSCRNCHGMIHTLIPDEKVLAFEFNTVEKLLAHPGFAKFVAWRRKRPNCGRLKRHAPVSL